MAKKKEVKKGFNENDFLKDLSEVLKKHNLRNCVFAGENEDDKMIGLFCIEKYGSGHSMNEAITCYANAARLYQSAREHMFRLFDKI